MVGYNNGTTCDRRGDKKQEDFVMYATKLGYKRDLAQKAERQVGMSASLNTKLRTLTNLFEEEKRRARQKGSPGSRRF